jgi:hypothetical protein
MAEIGVVPSCLQKEIVSPPERPQPTRDGLLFMLGALHVAEALGGDGADCRERILDAMVKLFQDQLLQPVGCLVCEQAVASLRCRTWFLRNPFSTSEIGRINIRTRGI